MVRLKIFCSLLKTVVINLCVLTRKIILLRQVLQVCCWMFLLESNRKLLPFFCQTGEQLIFVGDIRSLRILYEGLTSAASGLVRNKAPPLNFSFPKLYKQQHINYCVRQMFQPTKFSSESDQIIDTLCVFRQGRETYFKI